MSDIREEWFKLVLDELRKNNDKVDRTRGDMSAKIDDVEAKIEEVRIDSALLRESIAKHEALDKEIHDSIKGMADDTHASINKINNSLSDYNTLLKEHIRRTEIAEGNIATIKSAIQPVIKEHQERQIVRQHSMKTWKKVTLILGGVSTALGVVAYVLKLLEIV